MPTGLPACWEACVDLTAANVDLGERVPARLVDEVAAAVRALPGAAGRLRGERVRAARGSVELALLAPNHNQLSYPTFLDQGSRRAAAVEAAQGRVLPSCHDGIDYRFCYQLRPVVHHHMRTSFCH